eukprot:250651-Amorphochlora_amoeboformis.AAC.1
MVFSPPRSLAISVSTKRFASQAIIWKNKDVTKEEDIDMKVRGRQWADVFGAGGARVKEKGDQCENVSNRLNKGNLCRVRCRVRSYR